MYMSYATGPDILPCLVRTHSDDQPGRMSRVPVAAATPLWRPGLVYDQPDQKGRVPGHRSLVHLFPYRSSTPLPLCRWLTPTNGVYQVTLIEPEAKRRQIDPGNPHPAGRGRPPHECLLRRIFRVSSASCGESLDRVAPGAPLGPSASCGESLELLGQPATLLRLSTRCER